MTIKHRYADSHYGRLRAAVIAFLGGKCVRCGYDADSRAFQIDHVNGDGKEERRLVSSPTVFYQMVLKDTTGKYQLLCANCNLIKKFESKEHGRKKKWWK